MAVIVAQHGARRRYLVPRVLFQNGMLEALYTDSTAHSFCGKLARQLGNVANERLQRLTARTVEGIPASKVFSSDLALWSDLAVRPFGKAPEWKAHQRRHKVMSFRMRSWGTRGADMVYAMQDEATGFLRYAKKKGLRIVVDICVNPLAHRIVYEECLSHPGWEAPMDKRELAALEQGMRDNLALADIVICPSQVVADGVKHFMDIDSDRLAIVPYGSSMGEAMNEPVRGRVLFVGKACLRKGFHYFSEVAAELEREFPGAFECCIAGAADSSIVNREECGAVHFLGKLSREALSNEMSRADVFVMPTLAEGLPGALLEALSHGLPVVATRAAGLEISDGTDGLLIREGSASDLRTAIERVVNDRVLRETLAQGARELSKQFTSEAVGDRLLKALA